MDKLENEDVFLYELKKGFKFQEYVNEFFKNLGFNTELDPLKIRDTVSNINKFTDSGDLKILLSRRKVIVEIKSRDVAFTNIDDFPYETIFVDRVNTWKRKKKNKPHAIIVISQITNNMFVIPVSSENKWLCEITYDNKRQYTREYYLVKKENIKSINEFINWLNNENK